MVGFFYAHNLCSTRKHFKMEEVELFSGFYFILRLQYNYNIFPSPFLPPNPLLYPSLLSFKFMTSSFIDCCYVTYVPKYNPLSLNDITHMNVFRPDHLVLNNQLVYSSLGKTVSTILSIL